MLKRIILFACLLVLAMGCKEEIINEQRIKGPLEGRIMQPYTNPLKGLEGVEVVIEGTDPEVSATTDSDGRFHIDNLETGTYNITYSKEGYGQNKLLGYAFVGGDEAPQVVGSLCKLSNIKIEDYDLEIVKYTPGNTTYTNLECNLTTLDVPEDESLYFRVAFRYYISNQPSVSPSNYMETHTSSLGISIPIDTEKFPPGSHIYVVIYPFVAGQPTRYVDPETGLFIYTTISDVGSEVKSIEVL